MLRTTVIAGIAASLLLAAILIETQTSVLQSELFSRYGRHLHFSLAPGASTSTAYPTGGPYNERLGYVDMPRYLERAQGAGFEVTRQARMSAPLQAFTTWAGFSVYSEKGQAGLAIADEHGRTIYRARYPRLVYDRFEDIPPLVVNTLLFIENRELLDREPRLNPAVEWKRLGAASAGQLLSAVGPDHSRLRGGGSTLATQLQKFHHSPEGRTSDAADKLKQMLSASLKAYQHGVETEAARRQLVRDYLNATPLAGRPGMGEVLGLGDGLEVWFGTGFDEANRLLASAPNADEALRHAEIYRQVLMLLLAQRRPSYYLGEGWQDLNALADSHLRLLAANGIIHVPLRNAALRVPTYPNPMVTFADGGSFVDRKAINRIRTSLLPLLDVPDLYTLDRLDLRVTTPLHVDAQAGVTGVLKDIADPATLNALGMTGYRLLGEQGSTRVRYSVLLYQSTPSGNLLRVHADNFDQPFDMNDSAKLDLGSTAKLRTLISYLTVIERLYERHRGKTPRQLEAIVASTPDPLARWVASYLMMTPHAAAGDVLAAAMERSYSADPRESFFTGGGLHRFRNFERKEDGSTFTVAEAFRRSVNLPFVRLLRDVVMHYVHEVPGIAGVLDDPAHPQRHVYLARFADMEGRTFLSRFYTQHTAAMKSPHATEAPRALGRHPLEHWLVAYLAEHPQATWSEVVAASERERLEAYAWLFRSSREHARRSRIRIMLEREAFEHIHDEWRRLGYPFPSLIPSYATALGASADRPSALGDLMGIIVNDGVRRPTLRVTNLHFAEGTPFETDLALRSAPGERVLSPALAAVVRNVLIETVEEGTGRRLRGVFKRPDGSVLAVGGKTGTGDHRSKQFASGGRLIHSTAVNRNATLVFFIGEDLYGTITAHVAGPEAGEYRFTSALATQLLSVLAPVLEPLTVDSGPRIAVPTSPDLMHESAQVALRSP